MSAAREIGAWWAERMAELIPARLRQLSLRGSSLLADAQPGDPAVVLTTRRRGRDVSVPFPAARGRPLTLRLPAGAVLERTLVLPVAAEPELARVVGYEIARISPFEAAEVLSAFELQHRDRAAGRLLVRVALVPRHSIAPALQTLASNGLNAPTAVLAPRGGGGTWRIRLGAPGEAAPAGWHGPAMRLAVGTCAALALTAIATPFLVQQHALDRVDARLASLRPAVEEASRLRRRIAGRSTGLDALTAETARVGQALGLLATVTAVLPDDTYLTNLAIRQRVLTMSGRSGSAARLIPLLAGDPSIRNAAFAAPVTRAEGPRGEVFSVRAEFGP